jgi:release factor glutamine methyltransferase
MADLKESEQYISGNTNFFGLDFKIKRGVFIPRPETEYMTEQFIISLSENETLAQKKDLRIVDLCTGSGVIALTLANIFCETQISKKLVNLLPKSTQKLLETVDFNVSVIGVDKSDAAIELANENKDLYKTDNVKFEKLAIPEELKKIKNNTPENEKLAKMIYEADAIIANPPYVPRNSFVSEEVLRNEPHDALFSGSPDADDNGMTLAKSIIYQCQFSKARMLFLECHEKNADALSEFAKHYFEIVEIGTDLNNRKRFLKCLKV